MVDIWLIFNLLIPFLEIILISFLNMIYVEERDRNDVTIKAGDMTGTPQQATMKNNEIRYAYKILDLVAKLGLPAFYILFCIIFFLYGILNNRL